MSSPSSQESNPPSYNIVSKKQNNKPMSDEEAQLLNTNSDADDDTDEDIKRNNVIIQNNIKSRYISIPFIFFTSSSTILPLIIIILIFIMDSNTPFSLSFVLGIICCIFGSCIFIPKIMLKQELIDTYKLNQKKRFQTEKIHRENKGLLSARNELTEARKTIVNQNKETKQVLANLRMMNVDSLEGINESKERAQKLYQTWHKQLLKKERLLLHTLYDRFETLDGSPGMNEEEFNSFVKSLPDGYEERMKRLGTFGKVLFYFVCINYQIHINIYFLLYFLILYEKLSKGDGIIDYQEFKSALDVFAEMEINDEDIDFEIERQETGTDDTGKKKYINSIIKKSTKARQAVKNKWFKNTTTEP